MRLATALRWRSARCSSAPAAAQQRADGSALARFAAQIAALSEPGGYFDTDNLISNERSYLEVCRSCGGAASAVACTSASGPIRTSATSPPSGPTSRSSSTSGAITCCSTCSSSRSSRWRARESNTLGCSSDGRCRRISKTGAAHASTSWWPTSIGRRWTRGVSRPANAGGRSDRRTGVPLSARTSRPSIGSIGASSRPASTCSFSRPDGRRRATTPRYRDLLLATDVRDEQATSWPPRSRSSSSRRCRARSLVPVVGDLSGSRAIAAIGPRLRQKGQRLSAFYVSNVEFYLFGDGRFGSFVNKSAACPGPTTASSSARSSAGIQLRREQFTASSRDRARRRLCQGPVPKLRRARLRPDGR